MKRIPTIEFNATRRCESVLNCDVKVASTVGTTESNACGQEGSDFKHTFVVKPAWMKQELNRATRKSCYK